MSDKTEPAFYHNGSGYFLVRDMNGFAKGDLVTGLSRNYIHIVKEIGLQYIPFFLQRANGEQIKDPEYGFYSIAEALVFQEAMGYMGRSYEAYSISLRLMTSVGGIWRPTGSEGANSVFHFRPALATALAQLMSDSMNQLKYQDTDISTLGELPVDIRTIKDINPKPIIVAKTIFSSDRIVSQSELEDDGFILRQSFSVDIRSMNSLID
jgi:muconolactone delta-isomerase